MAMTRMYLRIDNDLKVRAREIAHKTRLTTWGDRANTSELVRRAIAIGLDVIEQQSKNAQYGGDSEKQ